MEKNPVLSDPMLIFLSGNRRLVFSRAQTEFCLLRFNDNLSETVYTI